MIIRLFHAKILSDDVPLAMAGMVINMYVNDMAPHLPMAGILDLPPGWLMPAHSHTLPELIVVTAGCVSAEIGDTQLEATAGDAFIHPAGVRHGERNRGRCRLGLLYLIADLGTPLPGRLIDRHGRLGLLVRWLAEDVASGASVDIQAGWLAAIRANIPRCLNRPGPVAGPVQAAMRARLTHRHTLEGLALSVGLGVRQMLRRYREETASTPMADLRRMRCEAAASLLATSDLPLARIADEVGFCDAFHLSKMFRQRFGVAPKGLRRR
jgi:AraC-like DNA-binding protein